MYVNCLFLRYYFHLNGIGLEKYFPLPFAYKLNTFSTFSIFQWKVTGLFLIKEKNKRLIFLFSLFIAFDILICYTSLLCKKKKTVFMKCYGFISNSSRYENKDRKKQRNQILHSLFPFYFTFLSIRSHRISIDFE